MRTTVTIEDTLMREAKVLAARRGSTVGAVLEDALREMFARRDLVADRSTLDLPAWGSSDGRPLLDILDKEAVSDVLDDGRLR